MGAGSRPRGEGYVAFAATLFLLLGVFNVFDGLFALSADDHFVADELFFGDLSSWGIALLIFGALQIIASIRLFGGNGVWLGIVLAGLNLVAHMLFLPAYPLWSVIIMVVDMIVIYGLCVYGSDAD